MKKAIIYAIMILIIIAGGIIIGVKGLEADIAYSKNIRIDVYLGKTFNNEDIKQITEEIFNNGKVLVQKVEYYEDMASITVSQENVGNVDEKVKQLNTKLNEKYELENKVEDITVTYQPKIKLSSILQPYLLPIAISSFIILAYALIRFRKIGIFKTFFLYVLSILAAEALFLSILAIARIPVNRLVMPIGLLIYIIVITVITVIQEKKYQKQKEIEKENSKK